MTLSGDVEDNPLARFSWTKAAVAFMDEAAPMVTSALKREAPFGSGPRAGRMRTSIRYERETSAGSVNGAWYAPVPYTGYVLDGTRPHLIEAKAARALRWVENRGNGAVRFAKSVHHPGTKPNPFPERAIPPITPRLQAMFEEAVTEAMDL